MFYQLQCVSCISLIKVKTCERLKVLRAQSIQYTIEDLEYPFTLYLLGRLLGGL